MERRKPKLLVIGHARHGKDTVGDMITDLMDLAFTSSSIFVGRECVWPHWGKDRYASFDEMFEDRVNFRSTWANLILAYNTPNLARTATEMLKDNDLYVGMRNRAELDACKEQGIFDYIIWVDGSSRHPPEGKDSNQLTPDVADLHIDNNGPESNLHVAIRNLQVRLYEEGFDVDYTPPPALPGGLEQEEYDNLHRTEISEDADEDLRKWVGLPLADGILRTWEDMPEGATQVLDHGFFKVLEVMGSDTTICESARMSYGRGTKKVSNDAGLINYLVRNKHTSPLEMGEIRFHIRMPIFVMRQWVRHRTANLNEYSGRYSEMVPLFYVPELDQICLQDKVNKQGSAEPMSPKNAEIMRQKIYKTCGMAFHEYQELLTWGVSRETARIVLPLNTYTEVVWKLDISNLIKFLWLRDDSHAQWEIRQYAQLVSLAVKENFPLVYNAYIETRNSQSFTPEEIHTLITGDSTNLSNSQMQRIASFREGHF